MPQSDPVAGRVTPVSRDSTLLFVTRSTRLFAYGFLSIVFVLYLVRIGLGGPAIGLLLALTLLGDAGISLWITTRADRMGRRRMLLVGAVLMVVGGAAFLLTRRPELLMLAAIVGVRKCAANVGHHAVYIGCCLLLRYSGFKTPDRVEPMCPARAYPFLIGVQWSVYRIVPA